MPISRSPMTNEGYFVPFMSPIPSPVEDVLLNRDKMIRFPNSYAKYILGALKPLARVETYYGESDAEIKFAAQQGMELLGAIEDVIECDNTPSNAIVNIAYAGDTYAAMFYVGTPFNHVSRYAFASISYNNDEPQLNQPRFWITSSGWVNPGCTWDITFQTRVVGRVYNIQHQHCDGTIFNDTGVMSGQFANFHYENARNVYMYVDVCDFILGFIDVSDVTCGGT